MKIYAKIPESVFLLDGEILTKEQLVKKQPQIAARAVAIKNEQVGGLKVDAEEGTLVDTQIGGSVKVKPDLLISLLCQFGVRGEIEEPFRWAVCNKTRKLVPYIKGGPVILQEETKRIELEPDGIYERFSGKSFFYFGKIAGFHVTTDLEPAYTERKKVITWNHNGHTLRLSKRLPAAVRKIDAEITMPSCVDFEVPEELSKALEKKSTLAGSSVAKKKDLKNIITFLALRNFGKKYHEGD